MLLHGAIEIGNGRLVVICRGHDGVTGWEAPYINLKLNVINLLEKYKGTCTTHLNYLVLFLYLYMLLYQSLH